MVHFLSVKLLFLKLFVTKSIKGNNKLWEPLQLLGYSFFLWAWVAILVYVYCTHQVPRDSERVVDYTLAEGLYSSTVGPYLGCALWLNIGGRNFCISSFFFHPHTISTDIHTIVHAIITCTTHYKLFRVGWLRKFILCDKRKIQSTKPSLILQHHGRDSNYTSQNTRAPSYPCILPWRNYMTHHPSQHYPLQTRYNSLWVNKHPHSYHGKNTNIHLNYF